MRRRPKAPAQRQTNSGQPKRNNNNPGENTDSSRTLTESSGASNPTQHHIGRIEPSNESSTNSQRALLAKQHNSTPPVFIGQKKDRSPERKQQYHSIHEAELVSAHLLELDKARQDMPLPKRLEDIRRFSIYAMGEETSRPTSFFTHVSSPSPFGNVLNVTSPSSERSQQSLVYSEFSGMPRPSVQPHQVRVHQLNAFMRALLEETTVTIIPKKTEIPACDCLEKCDLRKYVYSRKEKGEEELLFGKDGVQACEIWTCARGACMFWKRFRDIHRDGRIVYDSDASSLSEDDEVIQSALLMQEKTLADYWAELHQEIRIPIPEVAKLLTAHMRVPLCHCAHPKLARISICSVTCDMFWLCPTEECYYVGFCLEKPAAGILDIGQIWPLGTTEIDRYTTLTYVMKWCGYSFTQRFQKHLQNRESMDFPKGSYHLEYDDHNPQSCSYEMFLSYRGASGSFWCWATLCSEMNMLPALVCLTVVFPIMCGCLYLLQDPCVRNVPRIMIVPGSCHLASQYRLWLLFVPYGAGVLVLIVLFFHPIFSFLWSRYKIFFDKYSIHQGHTDLNAAGVRRLPLYLKSSKVLYCMIDESYVTRMCLCPDSGHKLLAVLCIYVFFALWEFMSGFRTCMWELAVYLRIRENAKVVFASITKRSLEAIAVPYSIIRYSVVLIVLYSIQSQTRCTEGVCREFWRAFMVMSTFSFYVAIFIIGQRHFQLQVGLRRQLHKFDINKLKLSDEYDRNILLKMVDELFRIPANQEESEQTTRVDRGMEGEGLRRFNRFVKEVVPRHLPIRSSYLLANFDTFAYQEPAIETGFPDFIDVPDNPLNPIDRPIDYDAPNLNTVYFSTALQGFRTLLALSFSILVMVPLQWFVLGATIRLFLYNQEWILSMLPKKSYVKWTVFTISLMMFLFWEVVLQYRVMLFSNLYNLTNVAFTGLQLPCPWIGSTFSPFVESCSREFVDAPKRPLRIFFVAFYGVRELFNS
eukprot:gene31-706_t